MKKYIFIAVAMVILIEIATIIQYWEPLVNHFKSSVSGFFCGLMFIGAIAGAIIYLIMSSLR